MNELTCGIRGECNPESCCKLESKLPLYKNFERVAYSYKGLRTNSLSVILGCGTTNSPVKFSKSALLFAARVSMIASSYRITSRSTARGPLRIEGTRPTDSSMAFKSRRSMFGATFVSI